MDPSKLKGVLGLFRPKPAQEVNVGRRAIMGLPRQAEEMLPSVVTTAVTEEPPAVVGALQKVIEDKMAKPTSRREFMDEGVKAAASSALRRAAPGTLRQVVKKVVETPAIGPATDDAIARALSETINAELNVPQSILRKLDIDPESYDGWDLRTLLSDLQRNRNYFDTNLSDTVTKLAKTLGLTPEKNSVSHEASDDRGGTVF